MTDTKEQTEVIPRFSKDLIELLIAEYKQPKYPDTRAGWGAMDDGALRRAAFMSGQVALVQQLANWQAEAEHDKGDSTSIATGGDDPYGQVFDPDGGQHKSVASVHVAPSLPSYGNLDAGGEE